MPDALISCPKCHFEFKLTESLAQPLLDANRQEYLRKLAENEADIAKREAAVVEQRAMLEKARGSIQEQVDEKVQAGRKAIAAEEARKAKFLLSGDLEAKAKELTELQQVLEDRNTKLAAAQEAQAELIRKQRELDDAKREMEITIEKRISDSLTDIRAKARTEAEEAINLKLAEKQEVISGMQRQIEELKRKSEQGSQQLQGEALELEFESILRAQFPLDTISPVPKGEFGGDLVHRVAGPAGQPCGTILWETKRTRNWSDGWMAKLKSDQRTAKAELAVIVSQVLPKGIETFGLVDGLWVSHPRYAVALAIALRHGLIETSIARIAGEGQQSKMQLVYAYLTGPRFRQRIEAIVEKFTDMQSDLDRERKATIKMWAKREMQIRGVIESTAGLYGDLQGISGRTMVEIEGLELPPPPPALPDAPPAP